MICRSVSSRLEGILAVEVKRSGNHEETVAVKANVMLRERFARVKGHFPVAAGTLWIVLLHKPTDIDGMHVHTHVFFGWLGPKSALITRLVS